MSNEATPVKRRGRKFGCFLGACLITSLLFNVFWCTGTSIFNVFGSQQEEDALPTQHTLWGKPKERNKIAVIRAEGALIEGLDGFILKQIEAAGKDDQIKAVVLRIDSPGGTIGASEDIHRELKRLVTGKHPRYPNFQAKKVIASMGAIAASGGYYIAMPAEKIFVEKSTITGSIGVYASFPNVAELAEKNGIHMELIKAGGIKGSGSPFHAMTPAERQPWQEMVDQAYQQFVDVVITGRPMLTAEQMTTEIIDRKTVPKRDHKGNIITGADGKPLMVEVTRNRADGGTFTASEAIKYKLVDSIGLLEDAVEAAASAAGITEYRVVTFVRPSNFLLELLGVHTLKPAINMKSLSKGLSPRLWYMTPGSEFSGILAITER
jgi:protease IV